ncbi:MAG TPA: hypothetical protein PKJ56_02445 [Promineifilum sp.]|nr:hypothetical protein [Promineifilum sp.]
MLSILISYWAAIIPTAVTGFILMGTLKKIRDQKAKEEKSLVPLVIREEQQG